MLRSKIHGALVTDARVEYEGSITLDADLAKAADLVPYEKVLVASLSTGQRLETYVILAPAGSGVVQMNGAAAHIVHAGERIIIMSFGPVEDRAVPGWKPRIVRVDDRTNRGRTAQQ
ncbi:MAG: aspartate 1-decarboxylase [Planctomycetes bacterium]|nr:aspartate 1-decarboxylase [Planctomycetota bacterium]